jgi:hypothetical protein
MKTLTNIILAINEKLPAAEVMENHNMELSVTDDGVELSQPIIAADIQNTFISVLEELSAKDCYFFLQHLLALKHYQEATSGMWATDMEDFIELHKDSLIQLEFLEAQPGWISKSPPISNDEDEDLLN